MLDVQMNVFELAREFELAGLHLGQNLVETVHDLVSLGLVDDAGCREHRDMRL